MNKEPPAAPSNERFDYVIGGGGLAGGLIALALTQVPGRRVALVEKARGLGGNHTWSFHAGDVPAEALPLVAPLVAYRWDGYDVAFPGRRRSLERPYQTITSQRFDAVLRARLLVAGTHLVCGRDVVTVEPHQVRLDDGQVLTGSTVIDARGLRPTAAESGAAAGYQKFVGLEVELADDGGLSRPLLMDATVPQTDGYRFMYVLPFTRTRLLFEDTYYSDSATLDRRRVREQVLAYIAGKGHRVRTIVREEQGVLPLPWAAGARASVTSPVGAGYGSGWFHPVTGYSLPAAVRVALAVAGARDAGELRLALQALWRKHERHARFGRWLNRMLFTMVAPPARWEVFARFYGLPAATIERFYSMQMTPIDRLRIVCGRPPRGTSLASALRSSPIKEEA